MSITFFCPEAKRVLVDEFDCHECAGKEIPSRVCIECRGSGKVRFYGYERELNVANGNAGPLLEALGVEVDYCGNIAAGEIAAARARFDAAFRARRDALIHNAAAFNRWQAMSELLAHAEADGHEIVWG